MSGRSIVRRWRGSASIVGYWEGTGREHVVVVVGPQWNDGRRRKGVVRVCHGRTPEGGRI